MGLWGWIQERLGVAQTTPAGDGSTAAEGTPAAKTAAPERTAASAKKKKKKKKVAQSKAERSRRRQAKRDAELKAKTPKKIKKKRRKSKGDPRLSGITEPVKPQESVREVVQTGPMVTPVFAPPVFGEPEPEPEPTPAPPPAREPAPAVTSSPAMPEPEAADSEPSNDAPSAPPPRRSDTLAWVVVPKLEALLASGDALLADDAASRDALVAGRKTLTRDWSALRPIPRDHRERLGQLYDAQLQALALRIDALPDPRAVEEAQNVAARAEIVAAAEALADESDLDAALAQARTLNDIWRNSARVSRENHGPLQSRWRAAMDAVYARREAQRAERLEQQQALVKRADLLTRSIDPQRAADAMKGLQAQWKAIGHAGRSDEANAAWKAFRAAADRVFERRREAKSEAEAKNQAAKEALIAEVEGLVGSELDDVEDVLRRLHQRWRRIGHVPRSESDRLWTMFRAACDRVSTPPEVDPHALGDGQQSLAFSPFAAALHREDDDAVGEA